MDMKLYKAVDTAKKGEAVCFTEKDADGKEVERCGVVHHNGPFHLFVQYGEEIKMVLKNNVTKVGA